MLMIRRRVRQAFHIGDTLIVRVMSIDPEGGDVTLGIVSAQKDHPPVLREEIYRRIQAEKEVKK